MLINPFAPKAAIHVYQYKSNIEYLSTTGGVLFNGFGTNWIIYGGGYKNYSFSTTTGPLVFKFHTRSKWMHTLVFCMTSRAR